MNNKTRLSNCCSSITRLESFGHMGSEDICIKCGNMVTFNTHEKGEPYKPLTPRNVVMEKGKVLSISFRCAMCKEVSNVPGAILFSPPKIHVCQEVVTKHHICGNCYHNILLKIEE